MPDEIAIDYAGLLEERARLRRIHRAESDLLYFAYEYFGDDLNPENDGNWIPEYGDKSEKVIRNAPDFHSEICDIMNEVSHVKRNDKVAVAAPRSHAKSSFLSKAYPIHEVVYRLRKYIIIISETPKVAAGNMEWISDQLKHNEKLRQDFGPLLSPKDQANIKDNSEEFIAWHKDGEDRRKQLSLVQAASTGQALRGRNWNGNRPDLIICDDLEDAKTNAATPEQRAKLRDWFAQVVIPLGDPKGEKTAMVVMGTTVAPDSLLTNILHNRSDFRTTIYRAIVSYPEREDLWEECRKIYVDRNDKDRREKATSFYERWKSEMEKGVKVLWQEARPIFELMKWKWDNGSKAFNTEYMNNPVDEESMIFNPEKFTYWTDERFYELKEFLDHKDFSIGMGVDPAMGKERGDYSAVHIVAYNTVTDTFFVLDSFIQRVGPKELIEVIVEKVIDYQPDVIAAEAQLAQEFIVDEMKRALMNAGYPANTRVKKVTQRSKKQLRIEAMQGDTETGRIQFSRNHTLLLEQFMHYPNDHDDGPDSLEMSINGIKKRKRRIIDKPAYFY
ncbi:phage terminase large subunit [Salibacterium aidingense]|uniref:phage terminase large subunit n=1 Tax=Salibacterium aidingense TaxID=384933 RepID=UPI003BE87E03